MSPLLHIILSWLLFTFLIPIIVCVFVPLKIYKTIVLAYARLFRKELKNVLTSYDSIFAIDDFYGKPYAGNGTVLIVDGHLDIRELREKFITNVLSVKKESGELQFLKLLQVPYNFCAYYFWTNVQSLDLEAQIRICHTFSSEDHETELHEILGKITTDPFPGPLWEILILEKFKQNQTVVLFRLHHVLGDGYTFNHIIDRLIGKESDYLVKKNTQTLLNKIKLILTAPSKLFRLYADAFTHKDICTQRKVNTSGVLSMTTLDLESMKGIRRFNGTHFATVGMTLLTGALRRHFLENKKEIQLPKWISIMHSLPKPDHPLKDMVNHWGVGLFKIPMQDDEDDSIGRLKGAEESFKKYESDQYKELIHGHLPLFNLFPAKVIKLFFSTNFGTGVGFTSVPGYAKEAFLFGQNRVSMMYKVFGLQWKETAVAAAMYTQNSKLGFTIYANKDIFPDQASVDRLTRIHLQDEFKELLKQCGISRENNNYLVHGNYGIKQRNNRSEGFA